MRDTLRGAVIDLWQREGRLRWDVAETLRHTKTADKRLEREGKSPAPAFRSARLQNDEYYMSVWVSGCRFPWLRSRRTKGAGPRSGRPPTSIGIAAVRDQEGNLADAVTQLDILEAPLYVTQLGKPRAVLVKYEDYQALLERLENLEDALAMQQALHSPEDEAVTLEEYERQRSAGVSR